MIALLVVTDGRDDCLDRTIQSAEINLSGPITSRIMYDDTGSPVHRELLADRYSDFELHWHPDGRQGFAGAIQYSWKTLLELDEEFIFHLEGDFVFNRPIDLMAMMEVMNLNSHLSQVVLKRQPWNQQEKDAGGIVECWPDEYDDCSDGINYWLEHRLFFSTNPSLYKRELLNHQWPDAPNSERKFSERILENPKSRFAFWGKRSDPPWVEHIGTDRVGTGY